MSLRPLTAARTFWIAALIAVVLSACGAPAPTAAPSARPLPTSTPTAAPTAGPPPAPLPVIAFVNGTLIDGTGGEPVPDAALVIRGGRIAAAGPRSAVQIPPEASVVDVQGGTILPGFINAHVHGAYNFERLAAWAQAGVTTVRDVGSGSARFALRDEAARDPRYARLVAAGPMVTVPGGYPSAIWNTSAATVTTPEKARDVANDLLDQGADVIKIALESGVIFGRPDLPMLSPDEVAAIVDVAHRRGTRVSAHVTISADLARALDGGVDDIAHMVTDRVPDELIVRMIAGDVYWVPTLELWRNVGQGMDRYVLDNLGRFVTAGGKVALGTDFEGYSTPFELGMPTLEIGWMRDAGMTPMQIIVAGTRNAAAVCNLEKDLGTLEAGKIADVLVVQGDPLTDLRALGAARWVVHGGVMVVSPPGLEVQQ